MDDVLVVSVVAVFAMEDIKKIRPYRHNSSKNS